MSLITCHQPRDCPKNAASEGLPCFCVMAPRCLGKLTFNPHPIPGLAQPGQQGNGAFPPSPGKDLTGPSLRTCGPVCKGRTPTRTGSAGSTSLCEAPKATGPQPPSTPPFSSAAYEDLYLEINFLTDKTPRRGWGDNDHIVPEWDTQLPKELKKD